MNPFVFLSIFGALIFISITCVCVVARLIDIWHTLQRIADALESAAAAREGKK